jgi:hypothetical protein
MAKVLQRITSFCGDVAFDIRLLMKLCEVYGEVKQEKSSTLQ